jgi:hypothetical protein
MSEIKKGMVAIRLDSPIDQAEGKSRGIPGSLSRLVISGERAILAALLAGSCPGEKGIFVQPIGPFLSPHTVAQRLTSEGAHFVLGNELLRVRPEKVLIDNVLSGWEAEALAIFFAEESGALSIANATRKAHPKWWTLTNESYEAPYLSHLGGGTDPFFFYSSTRSSLEVIGSSRGILEEFDCVRSLGLL